MWAASLLMRPRSQTRSKRVAEILERYPVISLHEHTAIVPEDTSEIFEQRRQGRDWTGYAGLVVSQLDALGSGLREKRDAGLTDFGARSFGG